jgi:hypothetical protein
MAAAQSARAVIDAVYIVDSLLESVCESKGPRFDTLKKNRQPLTPEERERVLAAGAVWHQAPGGEASAAIWKSVVNGRTWYSCHTHRCYQVRSTLKGAISAFKFVKTTA